MKRMLLFLAMLLPMAASAYDFMVDGVAYNVVSATDLTCVVTEGCVPNNGKLVIPATVNYKNRTLTVVGIGEGNPVADYQAITELTIENGPTYIEAAAFRSQMIQIVRIPPSIKLIKSDAFGNNYGHSSGLASWIPDPFELIIEDGQDILEGEAPTFFPHPFNQCKVTRLYLGRSIDDKVFWGFSSVEEMTIGDMVTSLGNTVPGDYDMSSLKKLTIGKNLESVPNLKETSLDEIYLRSETPPLAEGFKDGSYVSATLYVPRGTSEAYSQADTWKDFWTIEEYDVTDNNPNAPKEPEPTGYAVFDSETGTLTFKYGVKPEGDNVYETLETEFDFNIPAPWVSNDLKYVVFDESYSKVCPKSTAFWFDGATNLRSISGIEHLNTSEVTKMTKMFSGCLSLRSLDVSHFNTENVWTMNGMFGVCENLVKLDLSSFNTDKVIDMGYMFSGCKNLIKLNLSSFNTSNVVSMILMFNGCSMLTQLDLRSFNTKEVTNMENMFSRCSKLRNIYVGNKWTIDNVTKGDGMFIDCLKLTGSEGTKYDGEHKDKDYACVDGGADKPGYLSLGGDGAIPCPYAIFDKQTGTLTFKYGPMPEGNNVHWLDDDDEVYWSYYKWWKGDGFYSPWSPANEYIQNVVFDASYANARPQSIRYWFAYLKALTSVKGLENINTSELTNMEITFYGCTALTSIDLSGFASRNVTNMNGLFSGCSSLKTVYADDKWSTASVTDGRNMFKDCTSLIGGAGTKYDAEHVDHTYAHIDGGADNPGYFSVLGEVQKKDSYAVLDGETGTLTFMYGDMPEGDNVFWLDDNEENYLTYYKAKQGAGFYSPWSRRRKEIKTVVFDKSYADARPQFTSNWFMGLESLTSVKGLENINTSELTNMSYTFYECAALTSIDLSGFASGNVTNMAGMFSGCSSLKTVYADDKWSTASVTDGRNMFKDCTNLVGGAGSMYDADHVDHTYAHLDGGKEDPGYFSVRKEKGDVNCDDAIDAQDLVDLIAFIAGRNPENVSDVSADINDDSKVDIADVIMLANMIINK